MPKPYLLQVHSHPIRVPHSTWSQWYSEEHIRDMVYFQACQRGAFYRATSSVVRSPATTTTNGHADDLSLSRIPSAIAPEGNDFKGFLALYQTDKRHCLESEEYMGHVRRTSDLWDGGCSNYDVGSFAPVDLELVEPVDGSGGDEEPAPHIIHTKITGPSPETWLQRGVSNAASSLSGYRRSLVYRPIAAHTSPDNVNGDGEAETTIAEPYVIVLHEFDQAGGHGKGLESVKEAMEAIEGSAGFSVALRAYELVSAEGFGGGCRVPERLPADSS